MRSRILVFRTKTNSFTDQASGKKIESFKLSYLPCEPGENMPGEMGIPVIDGESLPYEQTVELREVPGFYDLSYSPQVGKDKYNKTIQTLRPTRLSFVGGAAQALAELIASGNLKVAMGSAPGGTKP